MKGIADVIQKMPRPEITFPLPPQPSIEELSMASELRRRGWTCTPPAELEKVEPKTLKRHIRNIAQQIKDQNDVR